MEMIILWISSIIASFGMELGNELKMIKDIADNGYKLDIDKLSEFTKQMNPKAVKASFISFLIPIVNIMLVLQRTIQYNNARHTIIDQLNIMDTLIPMTNEEQKKYEKKPTAFNAIMIYSESKLEEERKTVTFNYIDNEEKNSISYTWNDDNQKITKTEGPIGELSYIEQLAKLEELQLAYGLKIYNASSIKELEKLLNSNNITLNLDEFNIDEYFKENPSEKKSDIIKNRKETLELIKNEISLLNSETKKEDILIKSKKRQK